MLARCFARRLAKALLSAMALSELASLQPGSFPTFWLVTFTVPASPDAPSIARCAPIASSQQHADSPAALICVFGATGTVPLMLGSWVPGVTTILTSAERDLVSAESHAAPDLRRRPAHLGSVRPVLARYAGPGPGRRASACGACCCSSAARPGRMRRYSAPPRAAPSIPPRCIGL